MRKIHHRLGRATAIIGFIFSNAVSAANYVCVPLELFILSNRVHVECAPPASKTRGGYPVDTGNEIKYFALPLINDSFVTSFVQMGNISMTAGMPMVIRYTSGDYSGEAFGCARTDCRTPESFSLHVTDHVPAVVSY